MLNWGGGRKVDCSGGGGNNDCDIIIIVNWDDCDGKEDSRSNDCGWDNGDKEMKVINYYLKNILWNFMN